MRPASLVYRTSSRAAKATQTLSKKKRKEKEKRNNKKRSFLRVMQLARMMGFERGKVGGKAHLLSITSMAPERVTTCLSPFAQD